MLMLLVVTLHFLSARASVIKNDADDSRIFNGNVATPGQFPFAVSLQQYFNDDENRFSVCTFSLITPKTCLGAAHCVFDEHQHLMDPKEFCVIVGSNVQNEELDCYEVASVIPHPKYDRAEVTFDIALATLKDSVTLGQDIETAKLAGPSVDILGKQVTALGWGDLVPDGDGARRLRYTSMDVVANSICEKTIGGTLLDNQVCLYKKGTGTCSGDSGGPIVFTGTNVQIALVSFGIENCGYLPSVYTDVRKFIDWVKENSDGEPEVEG